MYKSTALLTALVSTAASFRPVDETFCSRHRAAAELCHASTSAALYLPDNNILCIQGTIDLEGKLLKAVQDSGAKSGVVVVIDSDGGSVRHAIQLVEFLESKMYSVVVNEKCYSSCAQFVFLGASTKVVLKNGTVAMHGYPFTNAEINAMKLPAKYDEKLRRTNAKFRAFFRDRHIPLNIISRQHGDTGNETQILGTPLWVPSQHDYDIRGIKVNFCS